MTAKCYAVVFACCRSNQTKQNKTKHKIENPEHNNNKKERDKKQQEMEKTLRTTITSDVFENLWRSRMMGSLVLDPSTFSSGKPKRNRRRENTTKDFIFFFQVSRFVVRGVGFGLYRKILKKKSINIINETGWK